MRSLRRLLRITFAGCAVLAGVAVGYALWGVPKNWYRDHDVSALSAGAQNDLIRLGQAILVDTPTHIGKSAADPAKRYAGNDLACVACHIDGGLKPFAAPLVSTFTSYPLMIDDRVLTLTQRINGCMTRSMNGTAMPEESREMQALVAYMQFVSRDTPAGVRVPGMGLKPLPPPPQPADAGRGEIVYRDACARCHGTDGEGQPRASPAVGWTIPPLWGDGSFNAAAGMAQLEMAAAFIHANMPPGATAAEPLIGVQEAWDAAAYVTTRPRSLARQAGSDPR